MPILIPFTSEHFSTLSRWFRSEKDVVQWGGPMVSHPLDPDQMQAMLEEGDGDLPRRLCWMAVDQNHNPIGHIQLSFDWRNGIAIVGRVALAPDARGRGLATPMLRRVLNHAFGRPAIERVELYVYSWNAPAIRTYLRAGFVHEGTRRSCAKVDNERWDSAIMGILRPEWEQSSG